MNATPQSAQDDLSFMRALVASGGGVQQPLGRAYFTAGLCYGLQMVLSAAQTAGWLTSQAPWPAVVGLGPTVVFLIILTWMLWRGRRTPETGAASRAIGAVFASVGMANLALALVIASVAFRQHSLTVWLIYPCAVFVLQGAAWLVTYMVRRRGWMLLVTAGWVIAALTMAWFIERIDLYVLTAGVAMLACMVAPGWVMMRGQRATV